MGRIASSLLARERCMNHKEFRVFLRSGIALSCPSALHPHCRLSSDVPSRKDHVRLRNSVFLRVTAECSPLLYFVVDQLPLWQAGGLLAAGVNTSPVPVAAPGCLWAACTKGCLSQLHLFHSYTTFNRKSAEDERLLK